MSALGTRASGYVHSKSTSSEAGYKPLLINHKLTNNHHFHHPSATSEQQQKPSSMLATTHHHHPHHLLNVQQVKHGSVNSTTLIDDDNKLVNNSNNAVIQHSINNNDSKQKQEAKFKYRVGYWWSEKKSQKLNATELEALFAERQCELIKIDLDRPLEEQGPFSLIVHKISDILVKADQGDSIARKTISAFESYVRKHPETVIMDPLDNNRALLDRYKQYRLIEQSGLAKEGVVFTPPFVHLTSTNIDVNRGRIRRSKITFPLVCKPILAQGSTGAHQMCIIFNEAGLKDVKPPCVAQSFVNHNAKLFKLFVIKDKYYIMERPSLKNFQAGDKETVFFYSHDISKPNSSSSLTELDEQDKLKLQDLMCKMKRLSTDSSNIIETTIDEIEDEGIGQNLQSTPSSMQNKTRIENKTNLVNNRGLTALSIQKTLQQQQQQHEDGNCKEQSKNSNNKINCNTNNTNYDICQNSNHKCSPLMPCNERLNKIVNIFSEKLGLTFYGVDIIIENGSSRYAIIDMNTFPGYDGVENFLSIFRDVVCDAIPEDTEHQSQLLQMKSNRRKPTETDSGIEST